MTETDDCKVFSSNLRRLVNASGKTQKEVAQDLGFSYTTFNTWCNGKIVPKPSKIRRVAEYFGVDMTELTEPHEPERKKHFTAVFRPQNTNGVALSEVSQEQIRQAILRLLTKSDYETRLDERLMEYYSKLNEKGKREAIKRIAELSLIKAYQAGE